VFQHIRFQDIDARVDCVAKHLTPARLLQELLYAPGTVGYDYAVVCRICHARQNYCGCSTFLFMKTERLRQVYVSENITAENCKRSINVSFSVLDSLQCLTVSPR